MPYCQLPRGRKYYEVSGEGRPLVLIAGLGTDATSWLLQVPALGASFRTVVFDNLCVGRSDTVEGPYSPADMADDVAGLLDHLEIPRAVVVGHSLGGFVAQHLALRHPDRVAGLVLAGSASHMDAFGRHLLRALQSLKETVSRQVFVRNFLPWIFSRRYFLNEATVAVGVSLFVNSPWPQGAEAHGRQVEACLDHDLRSRLGEIKAPTLVVAGDEDRLTPQAESDLLAREIPGARLEVIPDCGHAMMIDRADAFNGLVEDFARRGPVVST
ncbi:MAG: alpha/beta fold hydrolase [Armatimonadetes bacterium]|nr:alpha/beta fold hydrolase [Armatimonadota bacterium]